MLSPLKTQTTLGFIIFQSSFSFQVRPRWIFIKQSKTEILQYNFLSQTIPPQAVYVPQYCARLLKCSLYPPLFLCFNTPEDLFADQSNKFVDKQKNDHPSSPRFKIKHQPTYRPTPKVPQPHTQHHSRDTRCSQTWKLMIFLLVALFACFVARAANIYPITVMGVAARHTPLCMMPPWFGRTNKWEWEFFNQIFETKAP